MQSSEIVRRSDNRSKNRARKQRLVAKLYKVEDNRVIYTVTSSQHDKQYLVNILLLNLTGNKLRSLQAALNGDLKISCSCDAFLYQGYKYISWKHNAGINRETRAPNKTNPAQKGMACKHILVALEQMKSDYKEIYNLFKAQSAKDIKPSNKPSSSSDSITEDDVKNLDDFKNACDKLYKDYTDYDKSDHDDSVPFAESDSYDGTDPSSILAKFSKPAQKYVNGTFFSKLSSLDNILNFINQKKNGFNILVRSSYTLLSKKFNSIISSKTESLINNIILSLM